MIHQVLIWLFYCVNVPSNKYSKYVQADKLPRHVPSYLSYKMEKHSVWAVHVPKSASATSVGNGTIRKIGKCDRFR